MTKQTSGLTRREENRRKTLPETDEKNFELKSYGKLPKPLPINTRTSDQDEKSYGRPRKVNLYRDMGNLRRISHQL